MYIILHTGECNKEAIKKEVTFELNLEGRVCLVIGGKNIPGR